MSEPELAAPSEWLFQVRPHLEAAAKRGPIVDLACGRGRHARACAEWRLPTLGLDRNPVALRSMDGLPAPVPRALCDLETEDGIPLRSASCGAILVFRFLYRPLCGEIERVLAPGGVLVYETFTRGQLELEGGPRSPRFLLEPGELPGLFPGLETLATQEGTSGGDRPLALARLLARRP